MRKSWKIKETMKLLNYKHRIIFIFSQFPFLHIENKMKQEPIQEIEQWYRPRRLNREMESLFRTHVIHYWIKLTLGEIFEIIPLSKSACYIAYQYNYANFATFCRKAWSENTIDYRLTPNITIEQFKIIQELFKAENVIFPGNMPNNILTNISRGVNLIFYTCAKQNDGKPLIRPSCHSYLLVNLTINGFWNYSLTDPTIEILFTFQKLKCLTLNTIHISREVLGTLYVSEFNSLVIHN